MFKKIKNCLLKTFRTDWYAQLKVNNLKDTKSVFKSVQIKKSSNLFVNLNTLKNLQLFNNLSRF